MLHRSEADAKSLAVIVNTLAAILVDDKYYIAYH